MNAPSPLETSHSAVAASGNRADAVVDGGLYVQYGCGLCAPEGWLNFDSSPRLRLERLPGLRWALHPSVGLLFPANVRYGDIIKRLPVADGAARGVCCSHVLEHIPRDDLPVVLRNTYRMLAPGGLFRLVVPDLRWRAQRYLTSAAAADPAAADAFMESCLLGTRARARSLLSRMRHQLGKNAHLWMYDFAALKALLQQAGFVSIRRCELGDAVDPMFARVEDRSRFFDQGEKELAIEAARPAGGRSA